ncbi:hypothetical protein TrCOL_g13801 [Triparma columacea]|uniref:C2 domain-containing protein n=1 Tax=Triparma columacea TaxID=722753 RepID=A0A9W7GIS3_9STRA|nr:hypothetical protein TrCOL_g13801 [Triparma columacea]
MEEEQQEEMEGWMESYRQAVQFDKWGQVVEAVEAYQCVERIMTLRASSGGLLSTLTRLSLSNASSFALLLKLRIASIELGSDGPLNDDMGMIRDRFVAIVTGKVEFPLNAEEYEVEREEVERVARFENMTPIKREIEPKEPTHEFSYFSVAISRIGLKDASTFGYIDPYIVVTVADKRGCIIDQQQTPPARRIEGSYIWFDDVVVNLDTPISQLEEGNCGVFFELMHYKSKKAKTSCRAWAFMEKDEVKEGETSLEIYRKPADFLRRKKNIQLLSVKDLFLYVTGFVREI